MEREREYVCIGQCVIRRAAQVSFRCVSISILGICKQQYCYMDMSRVTAACSAVSPKAANGTLDNKSGKSS